MPGGGLGFLNHQQYEKMGFVASLGDVFFC